MEAKLTFDIARQAYGGSKNGLDNEYANFVYRAKSPLRGQPRYDIDETVNLLLPAIESLREERGKLLSMDKFVPPWPMLGTWINQQRWTKECGAKKVAEQRTEDIKAKKDKQNREVYGDWIMEQDLETLYNWSNSPQFKRLKPLVAELRSEIIEYAKERA